MGGLEMNMRDSVAVVTGGSQGIGRATVDRLKGLGAVVASLDLKDPDAGPSDLPDQHLRCDVADPDQVETAFATVARELGDPAILVNNAGVTRGRDPVDLTSPEWDELMAIDLKSAWLCTRAVLPAMRAMGRGAIVNVASVHALATRADAFPYAAAKSGLVGLTRSLGLELAPAGIRVNAVCPGLIETPAVAARFTAEELSDPGELPLGRIGRPSEVADLIAFLASDRASFIVAAAIPVDGGVSAQLSSI